MKKYLKNVSGSSISISWSDGRQILTLEPAEFVDIETLSDLKDYIINSDNVISKIKAGDIQVGNSAGYFTDALEGECYFKSVFDDEAYLVEGDSVVKYEPALVTETVSGKKGVSIFLNMLVTLKELYNPVDNPIYEEGFQQLIGVGGREVEHLGRTLNLETIHDNLGWHSREIKSYGYQAPLNLLFYYGWTNSFNYGSNSWDNEKVAQDMSRYSLIVFGDGIQDPSHGDHTNAHTIINRIKVLNPQTKIFGYVTCNQTYANFQTKVDQWNDMQVHGIFMDECGYDYGTPRDIFNQKVSYVHGKAYSSICFVNAWNMDHIIGTANDASYPNSTWNAGLSASNLTSDDWYLLESFPINTTAFSGAGGYESKTDWKARGDKAVSHRNTYGINIAGVIDVIKLKDYALSLPDVVLAREYKFMCSDNGQSMIKEDIEAGLINRVVVAACSPRMHEPTFRLTCKEAGLNQFLFEQANIREHATWVNMYDPEGAMRQAAKARELAVPRAFNDARGRASG